MVGEDTAGDGEACACACAAVEEVEAGEAGSIRRVRVRDRVTWAWGQEIETWDAF